METSSQQTDRLLGALEELVELEGMYLRAGYYDLAVETRGRAEPIVQELVRLAGQPGAAVFQPRIAAITARSHGHAVFLQEKMDELRAEMRQTEQVRHRTAQVLPAYARSPRVAMPRFVAAG